MKKIALISHGCAKNLVDSELILGLLAQNGYEITLNEKDTDTVIVNTCSFICDAERESIRSILELVDAGKKVIVTGCLAQKHPEELKKEIDIPVEYEDERLTTVIAHDILSNNNVKGKKRKANVDAVSAVVILQSFIDKRKSN